MKKQYTKRSIFTYPLDFLKGSISLGAAIDQCLEESQWWSLSQGRLSMSEDTFLKPRLTGRRFQNHDVPLEVLKDFAVLEELLLELAKSEFLKSNPERQRTPRGFTGGVSLRLKQIEEGSVVLVVEPQVDSEEMFPPVREYLVQAREVLIKALQEVSSGDKVVKGILPEKVLGYFNRFGRSLQGDEAIEFVGASNSEAGRLTRSSRKRLLLASTTIKTITDEIVIRGTIHEANQDSMTCEIQLYDGRKINSPMPAEHEETIIRAFTEYRQGRKVAIKAIGQFNRSWRLQALESIEQVTMLHPRDVPARLDEFRLLKDGWLEGNGVAPDHESLDWLADLFITYYPDELPLPYTYPTEEGGVRFEWEQNHLDASLDIQLEERIAVWHLMDHATNKDDEQEIDLSAHEGWQRLAKLVNAVVGEKI